MTSPLYAALAVQAAGAADALTAEAWTLVPMKGSLDPDAARVPDPSRVGVAFLATFTDREARPDANSYDRRAQKRPGMIAGKTAVIVSPAALAAAAAAGIPIVLVQGDRLKRAADGRLWHIASVFPMPAGTMLLGVDFLG